jgi:type I restriction enzyme S subunit
VTAAGLWQLPEGWRWLPLGEVAKLLTRQVDPEAEPLDTQYVGLEHIASNTGELSGTTVADGDVQSKKYEFTDDCILYGKLRPYLNKVALATGRGLCSTDILPIRVGTLVDRRYLAHYMRSKPFVDITSSLVAGARLPRVSPKDLIGLPVPVGPPDAQQRAVRMLDAAASAAARLRSARAGLMPLATAAYRQLVGDSNPDYASWPEHTVAGLLDPAVTNAARTGPFGSALKHSEFVPAGIAVLGIDNAVQSRFAWDERRYISEEKYAGLRRYTVRPGDVIITIMGTTGRSAVVPDDIPIAISTKHLATLTVDRSRVLPELVAAAFQHDHAVSDQVRAENRGAIMDGLNLGIIKRVRLRVPPLEQQHAWSRAIGLIHAVEDDIRRAEHDLQSLTEAAQQQAFGHTERTPGEAVAVALPAAS